MQNYTVRIKAKIIKDIKVKAKNKNNAEILAKKIQFFVN